MDVLNECIESMQDRVNSNAPLMVNKIVNGKIEQVQLENYDAAEMLEELRAAADYYKIKVNV